MAATFRWTHIIDSLDLTVPDDAHFEKLPNGDDLEIGTTPAPHKGGELTDYEEVWRDVTQKATPDELSWILQSSDGTAFAGKVGSIYLTIHKASDGTFAARRQERGESGQAWKTSYESGNLSGLPTASQAIEILEAPDATWTEGQTVKVGDTEYVFRGVSRE